MFGFGYEKVVYHRGAPGTYWVEGDQMLKSAHLLIAGSTGCGKSTMIHSLIWTAIRNPRALTQLLLIDMKRGVELCKYEHLPHTVGFAETLPQALSALDHAIALMESRLTEVKAKRAAIYDGPDLYIVIDELGFLLQEGGQDALRRLTTIGRLGRAARIHLILATQDPSKVGIPAQIQQNSTCRVGLRCADAMQSRQIIGVAGCEALPRYGQGIMYEGPERTLIAIPMIPEEEQNARLAYWSDPANYTEIRKEKRVRRFWKSK